MKNFFIILALATAVLAAKEPPVYTSEGKELGKIPAMPLVISSARRGEPGKCGEKIIFTVTPAKIPANAEKIRIFQWVNGIRTAVSDYPLSQFKVEMSSAEPAHLMTTGIYIDSSGKAINPPHRTAGYGDGVFIEPEKLTRSRKRPADFDKFWEDELAKLDAVPMQVKRSAYRQGDVWKCDEIEITSTANIPVTGFLVMPQKAAPASLPAVVYFHGAGFKSSSVQRQFGDRAIVFDVNAHGIKNGMPKDFYRKLNSRPPADRNIFSHRDDREKSYFKDMFLRTVRAVDFVKSLPEWDGKTLIVAGRSQGGAQAVAAAALAKGVTLCIANVPALADHGGKEVQRAVGWPGINPKNDPAIAVAADSIDIVNLAGRITCETIMSIGMIDSICPPVSVWLTYQELKGKKDITLFPQLGHVAPPVELDGRKRIYLEIKK